MPHAPQHARLQRPDDAERLAQRPHRGGQGRCAGEQRHGRDRDPGVPAQAGGLSGRRPGALRQALAAPARRGDRATIAAMLAQRTLKSMTRAVGVGVHGGQRVELTLRPAPADTGIVFRRVDLPRPVDIKVDALDGLRHADGDDAVGRRRPGRAEGARPSSTCSRPAPGSASTTWSSTSPPRRCRSSTARRRRSCSCCRAPASSCRTRRSGSCASSKTVEVREGEGAALKWARLEPYEGYKLAFEIEFDHPAVSQTGQRFVFDMGSGKLQARDRARPHLRLHEGGRDDALARPRRSAAASTTSSSSTSSRCSTATACATTTSSSSTRSSTRSAT